MEAGIPPQKVLIDGGDHGVDPPRSRPDKFPAWRSPLLVGGRFLFRPLLLRRLEGEEEGGPGFWLALHPDLAVVQVDQLPDPGQANAVPVSLGGDIGFKMKGSNSGRMPGPVSSTQRSRLSGFSRMETAISFCFQVEWSRDSVAFSMRLPKMVTQHPGGEEAAIGGQGASGIQVQVDAQLRGAAGLAHQKGGHSGVLDLAHDPADRLVVDLGRCPGCTAPPAPPAPAGSCPG